MMGMSVLVAFVLTNIFYESTDLSGLLIFFFIFIGIGTILLSRLKFKRVGKLSANNSGLKLITRTSSSKVFQWEQIRSISLRKVNHSIVNSLGYFGGFFRYNHLGYRVDDSETFYDKIEINGEVYYLFITDRTDFAKLKTLSKYISEYKNLEMEEVEFRFRDMF